MNFEIEYSPLMLMSNDKLNEVEAEKEAEFFFIKLKQAGTHYKFDVDTTCMPEGYFSTEVSPSDSRLNRLQDYFNSRYRNAGANIGSIGNEALELKRLPCLSDLYSLTYECFGHLLTQIYGGRDSWEISMVLHHYSDHQSVETSFNYGDLAIKPSHLRFAHVDTTPPNVMKAMLYLTDRVSKDNGSFQYIPGSQNIGANETDWCIRKVVRNHYIKTDRETLKKFFSLPDKYKKRNTFMYLMDFEKNWEYVKQVEKLLVNLESPKNFILFNPLGVHTGGFIYEGSRRALQLTFARKQSQLQKFFARYNRR